MKRATSQISQAAYQAIGMNYVILSDDYHNRLGRGSFADVYRCHKLINGQVDPKIYVAKRISPIKQIPDLKKIIDREIELMFNLVNSHKLVMKILDFFDNKTNGDIYIIMDYCEGGDFDHYVESHGPFFEVEISEMLRPLAECLETLHGMGIIHRDLKLANLLLAKKPEHGQPIELRLTDFGLAKQSGIQSVQMTTCGTPLYMAPEIWKSGGQSYSSKVDVWAFGNMLYKMMYGMYCFDAANVEEKIQQGIVRYPTLRLTSRECFDLMLKCLRKDPTKRPSFADILKHPFFTRSFPPNNFSIVFNGYFGYYEIDCNNEHDLLAEPIGFPIRKYEPTIYEEHNAEVFKSWDLS